MEIGLVYSSKDPRQTRTREFLQDFVRQRGIIARIVESEEPVRQPTITINGCSIADNLGQKDAERAVFPSIEEIGKALEKGFWCL